MFVLSHVSMRFGSFNSLMICDLCCVCVDHADVRVKLQYMCVGFEVSNKVTMYLVMAFYVDFFFFPRNDCI